MRLSIVFTLCFIIPIGVLAQNPLPVMEPLARAGDQPAKVTVKTQPQQSAGQLRMRNALIVSVARRFRFLNPETAISLFPNDVYTTQEISGILRRAIGDDPRLVQQPNFCDPNFVGQSIRFTQTAGLILDDLLAQIHRRFNINFLIGDQITQLPIYIRAGNIPWNTLLDSQLFLSGVRAKCIDDNTIQLVKNDVLPGLQDTAEVKTKFIKLKYLHPFTGGNKDIAGRSSVSQSSRQGCGGGGQGGGQGGGIGGGQQNCGNFEKLVIEIEKILGIRSATTSSVGGGGASQLGAAAQTTEAVRTNRSVSVIPGRNILVVRATQDELDLIGQIISRADRAPFQVVIRALVYTANESRLRDFGAQTTIVATGGSGRTSGGIFGDPITAVGTLFDFTTMIGTVDFNVQANALQTKGVISIKSRPFAMVLDGDTADLDVGRQIPVIIQSLNALGGTPGTLEILEAGNVLSITPQVIDDDDGKAVGVNLNLQLESNDVDTSVVSQGIPSINRRSIQTRLLLNLETTVILGGFTVDSISKDTRKTPGLGDIPILGYLFKRRVKRSELNRLYFAISVSVIPYGSVIKPILDPNVKSDIPQVPPSVTKIEKDRKKSGN